MYENARILIIDDDESTLSILTMIFCEKGYEIETADTYVSTDVPAAAPAKRWQLPKRSLVIIKRSV